MSNFKTKLAVFLSNILICILSLVSVGAYFVMPLWQVEAQYCIDKQGVEKILNDLIESDEEETTSSINISDLIGEDGLTIPLKIRLETKDVLYTLKDSGTEVAEKIISDNLNLVIDSFSETLDKLSKGLAKAMRPQAYSLP